MKNTTVTTGTTVAPWTLRQNSNQAYSREVRTLHQYLTMWPTDASCGQHYWTSTKYRCNRGAAVTVRENIEHWSALTGSQKKINISNIELAKSSDSSLNSQ